MSGITFNRALVDRLAARVHEGWMATKRRLGKIVVRSRHTGANLMVPYPELPDEDQEDDRVTVRAVLAELAEAGHIVTSSLDAHNPPPASVRYILDRAGDLWEHVADQGLWCAVTGPTRTLSWRELFEVLAPITVLVAAVPLEVER